MDTTEKKKSRDFNIYYLNFSKVYEIAMMINNVILTKIETDKSSSFEEQYGFTFDICDFLIIVCQMGKAFVFLNNLDTINICNLCRIGFKDFTSVFNFDHISDFRFR